VDLSDLIQFGSPTEFAGLVEAALGYKKMANYSPDTPVQNATQVTIKR
jgi:hypothetical protein